MPHRLATRRYQGLVLLGAGLAATLAAAPTEPASAADDPYDHASQESCPRTPGTIIGRPQIQVSYLPGARVPQFAWTTKCPALSGFRVRWNFTYPDGSLSGPQQVEVPGYSFTPAEPEDQRVTGIVVAVIDNDGRGGVGFNGTGVVPLQVVAPSEPGTPTLTDNGEGRVTAAWTSPANTGGGSVSYLVRTSPGSVGCVTSEEACLLAGLKVDSTYEVTVIAVNSAGESPPSGVNEITPAGPRLQSPRRVTATAANTTIKVSWKPPVGAKTGTTVRYRVSSSPRGLVCRTARTVCTFRRLEPGASYAFTVTAVRGAQRTRSLPSPRVRMPLPERPAATDPPPAPPEKPTQEVS